MSDEPRRVIPAVLGDLVPRENVNTVASSGATETLTDVIVDTMHNVLLDANCTLTFPTAVAGCSFSLRLKQDGTGSRLVTWPASAKFPAGTPPTLSTGANKVDLFGFACFDGSTWDNLGYVLDSR